MSERLLCEDPDCSIGVTHYVDEHQRQRSIAWYEQRHAQLARRCANLRRNLKSMQRAHDRAQLRANQAALGARSSRDYYVAESNRLREQLKIAEQKAAPQTRWRLGVYAEIVLLALILWRLWAR